MNTRVGTHVGAIFNNYVAGESCGIGHNYTIADETIVCDVRLGHDQTVVTNSSEHSAAGGATMNGDKLADVIAFADPRFGRFALVLQILRSKTNRDKGENVRFRTNRGVTVYYTMRLESDIVAKFNVVAYDRIGTNKTALTELGVGPHHSGWVNNCLAGNGRHCSNGVIGFGWLNQPRSLSFFSNTARYNNTHDFGVGSQVAIHFCFAPHSLDLRSNSQSSNFKNEGIAWHNRSTKTSFLDPCKQDQLLVPVINFPKCEYGT